MSQPVGINKVTSQAVNAQILSFLNGKELACVARTQKVWRGLVDSRPDLSARLAADKKLATDYLLSWQERLRLQTIAEPECPKY